MMLREIIQSQVLDTLKSRLSQESQTSEKWPNIMRTVRVLCKMRTDDHLAVKSFLLFLLLN